MHLKHPDGSGGTPAPADPKKTATRGLTKSSSSSLPLGQLVPISSIAGPTYVTAQLLVQQVAYTLSDTIFSYSPEAAAFDLDVAARAWSAQGDANVRGRAPAVVPLQTRVGAGALALGYIFAPDFDPARRQTPQSLLAASLSLRALQPALDQLSLLYGVSSPFVAHVAAANYSAQHDGGGLLATEYAPALQLAEELGLGLVASLSAYEAQHMALFATLMAAVLPTLHVYDGLRTARETLRVVDTLSAAGVAEVYDKLAREAGSLNRRLDSAGKVLELLRLFNGELGTAYEPFEYHGHATAAETVLVVFGSVEAQLAKQVVNHLASIEGGEKKVGVINVRLYRPFVEEAFLDKLPASTRRVVVLGEVRDESSVRDASVQSDLFADVLAAVSFSGISSGETPSVEEIKYPTSQVHTPNSIAALVAQAAGEAEAGTILQPDALLSPDQVVQQYSFWDLDNAAAVASPATVGTLLSRESTSNVYLYEVHDNLVQGGVVHTELRSAKRSIEAPYAIEQADVTYVGDEKLLAVISGQILGHAKAGGGGKVILRLPGFFKQGEGAAGGDLEQRLSPSVRKELRQRGLDLFILDSSHSPALEKEARLLVELAFLKVARPDIVTVGVDSSNNNKIASLTQDPATLSECVDALEKCLVQVEVPAAWAEEEDEADSSEKAAGPTTAPVVVVVKPNSFVPFEKDEIEATLTLDDWQSAAKALAFKEAYGTRTELRPDLPVKTHTIRVKENRRLTPTAYDRNIFHIEFDLGDSGLTYNIGEALGIHADNDPAQVAEFISSYGDGLLDADALVSVPSREDPAVLETRTVHQALVQNLDILGKPPKRFFEALAEFATDAGEREKLSFLGSKEGTEEYKRLTDVDTVTYADVLGEFRSARPSFHDLARLVAPLKRREYSIASAQVVTPTSVALMIVVVDWVDTRGRTRTGQATRYLAQLAPGASVTASVKPSVMKLPARGDTAPLIMAGLGTGLAPFRAFVQHRALQKSRGVEVGPVLLYLGSRHQREEYLYGEEWEAYVAAGVITLLGAAFSRDQPRKIYIQDRMRQTMDSLVRAYVRDEGSFYLCGPTWPVPDVTAVLQEAIAVAARESGKKVDPKKEIERLKEDGRYVLEVY